MGRLRSEWMWVGNGEYSPGIPQTEKLSRKNTGRSLAGGWGWEGYVREGKQRLG